MAIAVEGSTTILMILDTVGYQDATIHLVMKGSHQDATIHLVVEEAQRKGIINPVAWNDLCLGVLTKEFKNLFVDLRLWLIIIIIKIVGRFCWRQSWFCTTQWSENYTLGMVWYLHQGLTISCSQKRTTEVRVQTEVEIQVQFHSEGKVKIFGKAYYISTKKPYKGWKRRSKYLERPIPNSLGQGSWSTCVDTVVSPRRDHHSPRGGKKVWEKIPIVYIPYKDQNNSSCVFHLWLLSLRFKSDNTVARKPITKHCY